MDEISISANTQFAYVEDGRVTQGVIKPEVHGFKLVPKEAILGGDASENAIITRAILSGELEDAKRDIVLLNGAYALFVEGKARDIKEGIEILYHAINSGVAIEHLGKIVEVSNTI
jgi:anthranilate phosphoribosyltransferase